MAMKKLIATLVPVLVLFAGAFTQSSDETFAQEPFNPAINKPTGGWPWTFKPLDLCTFPVFMDVGHFVQLKDCNKRELDLQQVFCVSIGKKSEDFPCYSGCEEIEVRANFPAIFGANLTKIGPILTDTNTYWKGDKNQISGSGAWEKLTVCLDAWKAELWKAGGPDDKTEVGKLTITVKPPDSDS